MASGVSAAGSAGVKIDYSLTPNGDLTAEITLKNGDKVFVNPRNLDYAIEHPEALHRFTGDPSTLARMILPTRG